MKTQWQKEIEKLHQIETSKVATIAELERLDLNLMERNIRTLRNIAYGVIVLAGIGWLFI
jgi:hypothetical protein